MTQMNLSPIQKQTHRHREQTCGCQGRQAMRGMNWEFGVSRYKLLHTEWINKVLHSTGNYGVGQKSQFVFFYNYRSWISFTEKTEQNFWPTKYIHYPRINHNGKE